MRRRTDHRPVGRRRRAGPGDRREHRLAGARRAADAGCRHQRVGAADRGRAPLRAGEHVRRRARHRSEHQQPRRGRRIRWRRLPVQRQLQQGHAHRPGRAGGPRRAGAADVGGDTVRHHRCRDGGRLCRLPHRLRRGVHGAPRRWACHAARSLPVGRRGGAAVHGGCDRRRRSRHAVQLLTRGRIRAAVRHPRLDRPRSRPARCRRRPDVPRHHRGR